MEPLIDILGWTGTTLFVAAYYLVSNGKLAASGKAYQLLNLVGAAFLGVNVFYKQAWPALALEVIWALIAGLALLKMASKIKRN